MENAGQKQFIGFCRVSTQEQADSRNGLDAQRAAIDAEAERRGWTVEHLADEGVSGKSIGPELRKALEMMASGQADGLIVAKLDRLARSIINAANIMDAAQKQKWSLVVLDLNLDLTRTAGRMMAGQFILYAQFERELIGERTADALAAKKARGEPIGRPREASTAVVRRIIADREGGMSFDRIAKALAAEGMTTPRGGSTWHPSTVRRVYQSATRAIDTAVA